MKPVPWVERVWFGGLCRYIVSKGGYDRIKGMLMEMADEFSGGSRSSQCVDKEQIQGTGDSETSSDSQVTVQCGTTPAGDQ